MAEKESAFPLIGQRFDSERGEYITVSRGGLTKREWFAAHAPVVPYWFNPDFTEDEPSVIETEKWDEWAKKRETARSVQWPYWWADAMITEGEKE
jgi:hypothetical protein